MRGASSFRDISGVTDLGDALKVNSAFMIFVF